MMSPFSWKYFLKKGTPLASRVAQGVSGPSSSCVWNPRVFADCARGWQYPFVLCLNPQGCLRRGVRVISWLQSPSVVILEPRKIKSDTVSTVSPSISHEVVGPDAVIFVF